MRATIVRLLDVFIFAKSERNPDAFNGAVREGQLDLKNRVAAAPVVGSELS